MKRSKPKFVQEAYGEEMEDVKSTPNFATSLFVEIKTLENEEASLRLDRDVIYEQFQQVQLQVSRNSQALHNKKNS